MIWILKVELYFGIYAEGPWEGLFEVEETDTLEYLHLAINKAIGFDDDHMYEFYISRTERSRNKIRFDYDNQEIYSRTIDSIYPLEKGMKFFYLFDYGDSWLFKITKNRKKPYMPTENITYPRLFKSTGTKPEQYPACDDWEEEA